MRFENEFSFDESDAAAFPGGLSEALCKAVDHVKHDRARGVTGEEGSEGEGEEEGEEEEGSPSTSTAPLPRRLRR